MKRFFIVALIACVTIICFNSCHKKVKLNVRYWETTGDNFKYPEMSDPDLKYEPILSRPNFGIAVSGGGTVSAALSTGYFTALEKLHLVEKARYIAGVSGGTWGSAPYCYLPADISDEHFLGPKYMPGDLTLKILEANPPRSMTHSVTHAEIVKLTLENIVYTHEAFTRAVGDIFLKPLGIHFTNKYFTTDQNAVSNIISRNPKLKASDFITLRKNRPYLIMNATIFVPEPQSKDDATDDSKHHKKPKKKFKIYPFEFTPLYSGLNARESVRGLDNLVYADCIIIVTGQSLPVSASRISGKIGDTVT